MHYFWCIYLRQARRMKHFGVLLLLSLGFALLAFIAPWTLGTIGFARSMEARAILALVWCSVVLLGFVRFKKRALWLLVGTPVALYWTCIFIVVCHEFSMFC